MSTVNALGVRRARPADLERLLPLLAAFYRAERIPFRRARVVTGLRRLLREHELGVVVVAESPDGQRLDGYAIGTFGFDLEFAGPDAFLTDVFVRAARRQRGLGARLLTAVTTALRDGGARAVTLLVWPENVAARSLYARAGFAEIPRVPMVLRLPEASRRRPASGGVRPVRPARAWRDEK
jgi:ribosomal protein S18 acetylase RimI-like enzyme